MSEEKTTEQATPAEPSAEQAYIHNIQQMNHIIRSMKVIPELPSEVPKETNALQKVEFPEEGGIHTYIEGFELPYRGFPYFEFVEKIDTMKKIGRGALSGAYHQLKKKKYRLITLLPALWVLKSIVRATVFVFHRMYDRFQIRPDKYSQPIRELYRAFSIEVDNEKEEDREFRVKLRDLTCMICEFDNAYRYRLQDVLSELDINQAKKNPTRELLRILKILTSREKTQELRDTWTLINLFIRFYLRFDRKMYKILRNVLGNLQISELALNPSDKQFCRPRSDYNFGFVLKEQHNN